MEFVEALRRVDGVGCGWWDGNGDAEWDIDVDVDDMVVVMLSWLRSREMSRSLRARRRSGAALRNGCIGEGDAMARI